MGTTRDEQSEANHGIYRGELAKIPSANYCLRLFKPLLPLLSYRQELFNLLLAESVHELAGLFANCWVYPLNVYLYYL